MIDKSQIELFKPEQMTGNELKMIAPTSAPTVVGRLSYRRKQLLNWHRTAFRLAAILLLAAVLSSCCDEKSKNMDRYKFGVTLYGGTGMSSGYSQIYCDSVQMKTTKEADIFIDGTKMTVKADDRIAVWSNSR